jgi:terminase small subunit-like protein
MSQQTRERIAGVWRDILEGIATGEQIRHVLAKYKVSGDMARAYRAMDPQNDRDWTRAKEESADADFDQIKEIANNPEIDPARARVMIDALRWTAGKRNPRVYGDKAQLDVNVRTVDLTQIINAANARIAAQSAGRVLEGVCRPVGALEDLL